MQDFPAELRWMTYLREWHVSGTKIRLLPDYLARFAQLAVLRLPKNTIAELPPEIGESPPPGVSGPPSQRRPCVRRYADGADGVKRQLQPSVQSSSRAGLLRRPPEAGAEREPPE